MDLDTWSANTPGVVSTSMTMLYHSPLLNMILKLIWKTISVSISAGRMIQPRTIRIPLTPGLRLGMNNMWREMRPMDLLM
jgi:hypothetical protein